MDAFKLGLSVLVLIGGVIGFYQFGAQPEVVRVGIVIGSVIVAAGIALLSAPGQATWSFAKASRQELRKVIWPQNKEAMQVTLSVIVIVLLVALYLWGVDAILYEIRTALVGGGS